MKLRTGVGIWFREPMPQVMKLARQAEAWGYDYVWYPNHKLHRDLYVGLTVTAMATRRVRIGTFIADLYSLHPALVAAAVATVDELSGGRAVLLLGAGGANFKEVGLIRDRPIRTMEEGITIIRRLFSGETVTFQGEVFTVQEARLQFSVRKDLPIWIATRGDRMFELAGRIADGVMIATYATPPGVRHALRRIEKGAASAGRTLDDLTLVTRVDTCVSASSKEAREAVKPMLAALLMGSYPDQGFIRHAGLTVPPELEDMMRAKNEARAFASGHLVPDAFVDAFAWAGTPDEVARQIAAVVELGIPEVCILPQPPPGQTVEPIMRRFIRDVMPRVRRLVG
ncbi:MAG: LLM class flavin-dependent oxidoreductase [Armatimonadota bacterium]|nr:LLM class flavin-dependent oxidoreductase [Armatimonadota bacterium]